MCLCLLLKIQRGIVSTWWLWLCWGHSNACFVQGRLCVCIRKCVYALWAPATTQLCYSGLMLVISCLDWIAADTVFAPARGQRLCECLCVCVRACMCVYCACKSFCECVSKRVLWGKMQDDSKGEGKGNRCGGILKASGHTHNDTHTYTHTLSPLACCAAVTE